MAKQFTIKGIIKFIDEGASKTIKAVDSQVGMLQKNTARIGKGVSQMNQGLMVVGGAGLAAGFGLSKAIQASANFEQQIARVGALSQSSEEDMALLTQTAKKLGGTTEFTAVQAGQGLEFLALAGLKAKDATAVLPTILDTAAAGALDLGRASDIVTDSMSALGAAFTKDFDTPAKRAVRMADLMSFAQANANTNIEQLGEAVKFGGGTLAGLGIPMEQIIASMGKLADAGLKGSMGGTSLMNMFNKLLKPSEDLREGMKLLGVDMDSLPLQDVPKTMGILTTALDKLKDPTQRSQVAIELFGVRGIRAFNALKEAGVEGFKVLEKGLIDSEGTAKEVADRQRATFQGMQKSFLSASERILIEIGDFFTKSKDRVLDSFGGMIKIMQDFGEALGFVNMSLNDQKKAYDKMTPRQKKLIEFAQGLKDGFMEAFDIAKETFQGIASFLKDILPPGENNMKMLGKMIAKFTLLAAVAAPLVLGLVGVGFAMTALTGLITGPINILRGFLGLGMQLVTLMPLLKAGIIKMALGGVAAFKMLGKGMLWLVTNPLGLWILGITAVVVAGYLLWKNWDAIWDGIKNTAKSAVEFLTGTFQFFTDWLSNASWGEIILKTLLFPIRAALTPIMELINFLANSSIGKKFISDDMLKSITSFTNAVSLMPTDAERAGVRVSQPESAGISTAREISSGSVEQKRVSQPMSADQPVNVSVASQPVEVTSNIKLILDGKEVGRTVARQSVENSERAGMTNQHPKNRGLSKQGQFATGFAR